jgi:hypothetical protein
MSLSLKSFVQSSKLLSGFLKPAAKAYAGAAGYRQIGKQQQKTTNGKIRHFSTYSSIIIFYKL